MDSLSAAPSCKTCVLYMLMLGPLKVPLTISYMATHVHDLLKDMSDNISSKIVQGLRMKSSTFPTLVKCLVL